MKAIFLNARDEIIPRIYGPAQKEALRRLVELDETVYDAEALRAGAGRDADIVFSTWGMIPLSEEEIAEFLPKLKALFYAAGTVQYFARPFLARGVRVFSGWQANGVSVANFTFAQILLAVKGYFRVQAALRQSGREKAVEVFREYPGTYGTRVGLLGCGAIGTRVARLLKGTDCETWVFDPFLPQERAQELGVRVSSMEEIFANCLVISNHLANLPSTQGIIRREHFMSMDPLATFINTGRGPQLNEQDLLDALTAVPTRTALLDVMSDEKESDSKPLARLANCFITPHMAGASGYEVRRMADYMIESFGEYQRGNAAPYEVTLKMLETMA